jgi:threonine aldolase
MKYSFLDDYSEGAHPHIIKTLLSTNLVQETGYGDDKYSKNAAELIKGIIENPTAAVHFVSGGTQANMIALAAMLKPYESVIAPSTGHINIHEAGAIEATGHKIHGVLTNDGKIRPEQIIELCEEHTDEHMVKPRVVFISNSTEVGTVYQKHELEDISEVCKQRGLFLYLDGARLGSGLTSPISDLTLPELSRLVDAFYIGGTKNGALLGEAIVINKIDLQTEFRYHMKQRGALLAKGRVIGIQFLELFNENLYFDLARNANQMAGRLSKGISELGYKFLSASTTNQIFPIFPDSIIAKLQSSYAFYIWVRTNADSSSIRLVTSWATNEKAVIEFLEELKYLKLSN